jgi:hypothetical protein
MILKLFSPIYLAKILTYFCSFYFWKNVIITLVFERKAIFFAENWQKSQKIVISTSILGRAFFNPKFPKHAVLPLLITVSTNPFKQPIQTNHSKKPFEQTIRTNHSNKPFEQTIRTSHSNKPFEQPIRTTHSNNPYEQTIWATHTNNPFEQPIRTNHLAEKIAASERRKPPQRQLLIFDD